MSNEIFDFNNTREALSQLSTDMIELEATIKIKLNEIIDSSKNSNDLIKKKDEIINNFAKTSENALAKIENITNYIDKVL
ncbi:MAG: hypothetical protein IKC10_00190 [Alphaproteobacteria bacterium]|nr:hypothetical protein [Alphaproteobacteria bacterium]